MSIHEMIELLLRYPNQERTVRRVQPFQNSIVIEVGEDKVEEIIYIDHKGYEVYGAK